MANTRMPIQGTSLDRLMSLLGVVERGEAHPKVTETLALLGDHVPPSDHTGVIGASHKQLSFIADLAGLSSEDPLLFHFLDVIREAGGIDVAGASHLIDALKKPVVLLGGDDPDVFLPYDLPRRSALILRSILEAGGDRRYVPKDSVRRIYDLLDPSNDLSPGTFGTMLGSLDRRRGLVGLTRDVLNASGHRLGTVHVRLSKRFVRFLEGEGVRVENLAKTDDKK